jgi:hypothetical protein
MWNQTFWLAAGLWNIALGTALWNTLFKNDKKARSDKKLRALVVAFGVAYILVGQFDWLWWFIILGMLAKLGVVLDYFGSRFDYQKMKFDMLTYVVIGDLLWVFGFGAMLGIRLSAMRSRRN